MRDGAEVVEAMETSGYNNSAAERRPWEGARGHFKV